MRAKMKEMKGDADDTKYFVMRGTSYMQKKPQYQLIRKNHKQLAQIIRFWIQKTFKINLKCINWMNDEPDDKMLIPPVKKTKEEE